METFQCNISQEQAWALIYQSTKTLNEIIIEHERNDKITELSIGKLTSFSNIFIDINGNVAACTWLTNNDDGHFNMIKSDDKRLFIESINSLIASLATVIYSALEWNWTNTTKCDNDEELHLEENLELLMLSMLRGSENKDLVDEGYIEALEDNCLHSVLNKCQLHFDDLISSNKKNPTLEMLAVSLNSNLIGADYYYRTVCKMMMEEALKLNKLVNQFCDKQNNYNEKLAMICGDNQTSIVDTEYLKIWAQTWIKVMSQLRFGVHLRPTPIEDNVRHTTAKSETKPETEKLMEQIMNKRKMLRKISLNAGHENEIGQLNKSITFPINDQYRMMMMISQEEIVMRLKNLKPASKRILSPPITTKPCLHECLMNAIRDRDYRLRPTKTIEKPSIMQLYLNEKRKQYRTIKEYHSLSEIDLSVKNNNNKRKNISGIIDNKNNDYYNEHCFNEFQFKLGEYTNHNHNHNTNEQQHLQTAPLLMRSETNLNANYKRKKSLIMIENIVDNDENYYKYNTNINDNNSLLLRNLTPKYGSTSILFGQLSPAILAIENDDDDDDDNVNDVNDVDAKDRHIVGYYFNGDNGAVDDDDDNDDYEVGDDDDDDDDEDDDDDVEHLSLESTIQPIGNSYESLLVNNSHNLFHNGSKATTVTTSSMTTAATMAATITNNVHSFLSLNNLSYKEMFRRSFHRPSTHNQNRHQQRLNSFNLSNEQKGSQLSLASSPTYQKNELNEQKYPSTDLRRSFISSINDFCQRIFSSPKNDSKLKED